MVYPQRFEKVTINDMKHVTDTGQCPHAGVLFLPLEKFEIVTALVDPAGDEHARRVAVLPAEPGDEYKSERKAAVVWNRMSRGLPFPAAGWSSYAMLVRVRCGAVNNRWLTHHAPILYAEVKGEEV